VLRAQECEYSTGPAKKAAQPAAASAEQGQVCRLAVPGLHDSAACMVASGNTLSQDAPCVSALSLAGSACRPARLQRLRRHAGSFTVLSLGVFITVFSNTRQGACCLLVKSMLLYILLQYQTSTDHGRMNTGLFSWHAQHLQHFHRTARLS
jgi:hypothetical protein